MLHVLVEGPSDESLLRGLLPRLAPKHRFQIYPHQGKGKLPGNPNAAPDPKQRGLLDNLAATLRAWGKSFRSETDRVVVLCDLDNDDCVGLLAKLKAMEAAIKKAPMCIFRLAIEETESWYLGDFDAISRAFPKAKKKHLKTWKPDSICGSWERFQLVVGAVSDEKVAWGEAMGRVLHVEEPLERRNLSPSFRKFCRRVREHSGESGVVKPRRKKTPFFTAGR